MKLTSKAFADAAAIPAEYTCEGDDASPPLAWSDPPPGTKSFVLVTDDPDAPDPRAPKRTWVHWVLYDMPATARELPRGVSRHQLPPGTREGANDWNRPGYGGPCPPMGRHRYFFKLYALDRALGELGNATKAALEAAMEGHVLAKAEWMGTYEKAGA
jgi:Raf kinase inhibitor-like YbhB/YbcL family protein